MPYGLIGWIVLRMHELDLRPFWGADRPNRFLRFHAWLFGIPMLMSFSIAAILYAVAVVSYFATKAIPPDLVFLDLAAAALFAVFTYAWIMVSHMLTYDKHDFLNKR